MTVTLLLAVLGKDNLHNSTTDFVTKTAGMLTHLIKGAGCKESAENDFDLKRLNTV